MPSPPPAPAPGTAAAGHHTLTTTSTGQTRDSGGEAGHHTLTTSCPRNTGHRGGGSPHPHRHQRPEGRERPPEEHRSHSARRAGDRRPAVSGHLRLPRRREHLEPLRAESAHRRPPGRRAYPGSGPRCTGTPSTLAAAGHRAHQSRFPAPTLCQDSRRAGDCRRRRRDYRHRCCGRRSTDRDGARIPGTFSMPPG